MGGGWAGLRRETATLVHALELDAVAAEVVRAFDAAGVESILLKGASLADWLYRGEVRPYGDVDLLVSPASWGAAVRVLTALGFSNDSDQLAPSERSQHADNWCRDDHCVDLHRTIVGATVSSGIVWDILSAHAHRVFVGGTELAALAPQALACLCALHAAAHGHGWAKPLQDLHRALEHGDEELWRGAAEVADELGAASAFGAGLRLLPEGTWLARRLGVSCQLSMGVLIRAESKPRGVLGLQQLVDTPDWVDRWRLLVRKLFPTPSFLRAISPFARRSRPALVLAYLWRPIPILGRLLPALIRWTRLRRRVADSWAEGPPS